MPDVLLGADLGTSGLKLTALGVDGAVVAEVAVGYALEMPCPGWAQVDVAVWRRAFDTALTELRPALGGHTVRGLGIAGQMHGAVLLDERGTALAPAVLWPDQRAVAQVDRWRMLPAGTRAALANPLVAGMTGPLVGWWADTDPDLLHRVAAVVLPKDALRTDLVGGEPVTDRSDASATLLWDVPGEGWSPGALAAAGIGLDRCPAVRPPDEVAGVAGLAGVGEVPVVVGGADTALALLATGTSSGLQVNLGTGAQVLRPDVEARPVPDPVVHTYGTADRSGWYAMAALQNAGLAWDWVRSVLGLGWDDLLDTVHTSAPGAGGVRFAPYLTGERGGVAGPDDRGGWSGLHPGTTRADLGRAALEGVAAAVAAAARLLGPDDGGPVVLTGGGSRDPRVQQLLADALGRPVQRVQVRSASATGAAVLAGRGVGLDVTPQRSRGPLVQPVRR